MNKQVYIGWQGHFIGQCRWHLNTLVNDRYVVSTVGEFYVGDKKEPEPLGLEKDSIYETMVFYVDKDSKWKDADWSRGELYIRRYGDEAKAQEGHLKACRMALKGIFDEEEGE